MAGSGVSLTGLWIKKSQDGKTYMEGSLGGAVIRVYKNDYKKDAKHPDYKIYLSAKQPKQPYQGPRTQSAPQRSAPPKQEYIDHTAASQSPPEDLWEQSDDGSELPF